MKFMKLGSKPDSFHSDEDNVRYVASELATDIVIIVGDVKFYLHKFPLLSKSARLQKLVAITSEGNDEEIHISEIPGGPAAFEICAKFCYGMTVTLSPYNVIAARCAAEYLEMYETIEKGNLIYKIDVFLNSSIFHTWKDSIIVFQTTRSFLPWSEELKIVSHCLDSIASKVSIDPLNVEWSYTYNRKNLNEIQWDGVKKQPVVPKDWWVEDLCDLHIDLYKRVIMTIKTKGRISADLIGDSLKAYTLRRLPELNKVVLQGSDAEKSRSLVHTIISLLPVEKNSVCCSFLLQLLQASIALECEELQVNELKRRIGQQLDSATTADLIFKLSTEENAICNIDVVHDLVKEFFVHEQSVQNDFPSGPGVLSNTSQAKVAKLVDGYLAEIARDPNLPLSKFVDLAETVSGISRPSHDGLYRAIDTYLKEHDDISKSERKRICRLMDCKKLSSDACTHAVQNERLPLRVVVQILFFEQMRATTSASGCSTPDLPGPIRALLPGGSHGSSRSTTTNTEEDWDSVPTAEELKAITGRLSTIRLRDDDEKGSKAKGLVMSKKLFSKLWSSKEKSGENSSSDTSESPCSTQETKSTTTPSRSRRQSLS